MHHRRRTLLTISASVTLFAGMVAGPATATLAHSAEQAEATVGETNGAGLSVRTGPDPATESVDVVATGTTVTINCQTRGETVENTKGFRSDLWDYSESLDGYVADAYMATGHDGTIPGVPACDDSEDPPADGEIVPIQQAHGQPKQWYDCGPTSVVAALLARGHTPREWNPDAPVNAINQARTDMGADGLYGTETPQVTTAFGSYGLDSRVSADLNDILGSVRDGHAVVLGGNTATLPWPVRVDDPNGVAHFLTVAGYDAATDTYQVVDPISVDNVVHNTSAEEIRQFYNGQGGGAGVIL